MDLSNNLISKFIEVTSPRETKNTGSVMYGTVEKRNNEVMVKLDGSELLTPVSTTADVINKERVMVMIQNHTATIVGNASSPSARMAKAPPRACPMVFTASSSAPAGQAMTGTKRSMRSPSPRMGRPSRRTTPVMT